MPVALFEVLFDFPRIGRVPLCPWTCCWIFRLLSSVFYLGGDRVDSLLHMDVFDRQEEAGETNLANSRFAGSNTLSTGKGIKVGSTISCPILLQSQSLKSVVVHSKSAVGSVSWTGGFLCPGFNSGFTRDNWGRLQRLHQPEPRNRGWIDGSTSNFFSPLGH